MGVKRRDYRFDSEQEVERYRRDMRSALARVNINRPFGRPLVPIMGLEAWHRRACSEHGVFSEIGGR